MSSPVTPGLLILHGNQLEQLRAAVFQWLRNHPLGPLESDIFLVQSNGVAEWLKIALAEEMRVCAATRVALPARFLWDLSRHAGTRPGAGALGVRQVAADVAFDALAAHAAGRSGLHAAAPLPGRRRGRTPPAIGRAPGRLVRPVPGLSRRLAGRLGRRPRSITWRAR